MIKPHQPNKGIRKGSDWKTACGFRSRLNTQTFIMFKLDSELGYLESNNEQHKTA